MSYIALLKFTSRIRLLKAANIELNQDLQRSNTIDYVYSRSFTLEMILLHNP
ncbi:MAG: hypothetical protein OFPI_38210 [Osedax symbiont Rs2]|nr:MAG: hypothetical protein OFPI_38210 [Osedax symbiont Rs2]